MYDVDHGFLHAWVVREVDDPREVVVGEDELGGLGQFGGDLLVECAVILLGDFIDETGGMQTGKRAIFK